MLRVSKGSMCGVLSLIGFAALLIAASTAQASTVSFGGSDYDVVFNDDFGTNGIDTTKWNTWTAGTGTITQAGNGWVTLKTNQAGNNAAQMETKDGQLSGLVGSNDWLVDMGFKVNAGELSTANSGTSARQYILLQGSSYDFNNDDEWASLGVDIRLQQNATGPTGATCDLAWYGWDNLNTTRIASVLTTINKGTNYRLDVHRKSDDTVDIYLDSGSGSTLIGTKAVITATYLDGVLGSVTSSTPKTLNIGDMSSTYMKGDVVLLDLTVGSAVPEPSVVSLMLIGLFGLLAYAWRKRR